MTLRCGNGSVTSLFGPSEMAQLNKPPATGIGHVFMIRITLNLMRLITEPAFCEYIVTPIEMKNRKLL